MYWRARKQYVRALCKSWKIICCLANRPWCMCSRTQHLVLVYTVCHCLFLDFETWNGLKQIILVSMSPTWPQPHSQKRGVRALWKSRKIPPNLLSTTKKQDSNEIILTGWLCLLLLLIHWALSCYLMYEKKMCIALIISRGCLEIYFWFN